MYSNDNLNVLQKCVKNNNELNDYIIFLSGEYLQKNKSLKKIYY